MRMRRLYILSLAALMFALGALPGFAEQRPGNPEAEAAIQKQAEAFVEAFHKGDARAMAALWAADGDFTDQSGQHLKGREAIEKHFAALFAEHKGLKVRIESDSLRFATPDVAVEDGTTEVFPPDGGPPSRARFTNVLVKKDGQWLLSSVRATPFVPPSNYRHLRGLEWAIGDWAGEAEEGGVERLSVAWSDNQNFIKATFATTIKNVPVGSATQRIGWDPVAKRIRSWVFDADGGFGEGSWARDGKKWVVKTTSVLPGGHVHRHTRRCGHPHPASQGPERGRQQAPRHQGSQNEASQMNRPALRAARGRNLPVSKVATGSSKDGWRTTTDSIIQGD
jgi:uncharacterized protein (TIGR02246 family)